MSWNTKKIKEVGIVVTGKTPKKSREEYYGGNTPFITPPNLDSQNPIQNTETTLSKLGEQVANVLPIDTVMVSCIGSLGKVGITGSQKSTTNQQINSIIFDQDVIYPRYGYHYCRKLKPILEQIAPSTTLPIINKTRFENLQIAYPPLEEQKRIAAILDKADQLRQQRQRAIDRLDDLLQSVFLDMFGDPVTNPMGWDKVSLGELAEVKTGGTPRRDHPEYYGGNIPWVKTTEVVNSVIVKTEESITDVALNNSNCRLFPKDTIIIAMYGQGLTRGRTAKLGIPATTNQACAAILPSQTIATDYLWVYLQLSYEQLRFLGRGGNQPNLNLSLVRNFEVILPNNEYQKKFANIVNEIHLRKQHFIEQTKQIDALNSSILHRAFRGEL